MDPTDPNPTAPNPAPAPSSGRALRDALAGAPPLDDAIEADIGAATGLLTEGNQATEGDPTYREGRERLELIRSG